MQAQDVNFTDPDDRCEVKLAVLRKLAAEGFDALDRGEAIVIDGKDALAAFIGEIGERAARRVEQRSRDDPPVNG